MHTARGKPKITPSILASIPQCLRTALMEKIDESKKCKNSLLISSNSLANRFILDQWDIRPSQRRQYKNLFSVIRERCRTLFNYYSKRRKLEWTEGEKGYYFGVHRFDKVRGNVILRFVSIPPDRQWAF